MLSDIHANLPAFKAVLEAAKGQYDQVLFLGDLANFGPHPVECVELMKEHNAICIMGNHDEQIVAETQKQPWDKWAKEKLSGEQLQWLSEFKDSYIIDGHILVVHGVYTVNYDILPNTPDDDIKSAFKDILTPEIDEEGIPDFTAMEKKGYIQALSAKKWHDRQYLWPIPSKEIVINNKLTQNTGY